MNYSKDLDHALKLADAADEITTKYYRSVNLDVKTKPDKSPVTKGDLETEARLRDIVINEFKESYLGEENGREGDSNRLWIIDPIDGTKNFMRAMPVWGTLIALTENGETVAAAVSTPALGRRWWAAKGMGAWTKDVDGKTRQIHVSGIKDVSNSFLMVSTPLSKWDNTKTSQAEVHALLTKAWRWRALGDMLNYMMVAEGAADACFEPVTKQWDVEAVKLVVTEAGGHFYTNAKSDTPADKDRAALATNGHLDRELRKVLQF